MISAPELEAAEMGPAAPFATKALCGATIVGAKENAAEGEPQRRSIPDAKEAYFFFAGAFLAVVFLPAFIAFFAIVSTPQSGGTPELLRRFSKL
jgi:hypothetical protein